MSTKAKVNERGDIEIIPMNIYEKLAMIQHELVAPKGQRNDFGKYNYRSCEDIEVALKPLLAKYRATVLMDGGKMERIGDRYYMTVKVRFIDLDNINTSIETSSVVREEENKKGMDATQVSGSAMSYARKYCLAGLFLIDNEKDADTNEYTQKRNQTEPKPEPKPKKEEPSQEEAENMKITDMMVEALSKRIVDDNINREKLLKLYKVNSISELTMKKFRNINENWEKVKASCVLVNTAEKELFG